MSFQSVSVNWGLAGGVVALYFFLAMNSGTTLTHTDNAETDSETPTGLDPTDVTGAPSPPLMDANPAESDLPDPPAFGRFPEVLEVCGSMTISNRPSSLDALRISNYTPWVDINGVRIAVAPVEAACFSSGFGPRGTNLHKGIDLHNPGPVDVFAAADGLVRHKLYRDDYGNMIVIDHGDGVFTRYAHLETFNIDVEQGSRVKSGDRIGVMGNTASYRIPRHLHYEILTGEWGALSGSFGLEPINIMAQLPEN